MTERSTHSTAPVTAPVLHRTQKRLAPMQHPAGLLYAALRMAECSTHSTSTEKKTHPLGRKKIPLMVDS
jgi:hypothetical protein